MNAAAGESVVEGSAYVVTYWLEVPRVERFATGFSTRICVPDTKLGRLGALPVLSQNNSLAKCPASAIRSVGENLTFDIHCLGRSYEAAQASAVYKLKHGHFEGRIHMLMGGKNMNFVEAQNGHRVGDCSPNDVRKTVLR